MATSKKTQQFVLLPVRGLRAAGRTASDDTRNFLMDAASQFMAASQKMGVAGFSGAMVKSVSDPGVNLRVIDSIHEDGAKLVELSAQEALTLRERQPGLKLVPVVYFYPQVQRKKIEAKAAAASGTKIRLTLVSKADGKPVAGAMVVAFSDFANRIGLNGTTNNSGSVDLAFGTMTKKLDRLYVYPRRDFWSFFKRNITIASGDKIRLLPVDLSFTDALRQFYGNSPDNAGAQVKVAVIDSGIDLHHPDLTVAGGENTVQGEQSTDFGDNGGEGHGTHVGGIIAAHGKPPTGIRGLAPAASLFSFRVFGRNADGASNFAIAKAIDRAVQTGCDIINMSLGGGDPDDATRAAMEDALSQGSLVIVASGNDDRSPVSFPASASPPAIAVSAMGRKGTFPAGTTGDDAVAKPFGADPKNFIAAFSNIGPEIDLTSTGVGIISTVPGGHLPMDGTSMATPAVSGFAARLLSGMQNILTMPRTPARANAMAQALFGTAKLMGFGPNLEGQGFPR
jgi:subtilisin family serine protease